MALTFTTEVGIPVQVSASKLAKTGAGSVIGIFVSSVLTSSKIALCDAVSSVASAGVGRFLAPVTLPVGFTQVRAIFNTGLYVSLSGSAQQATVIMGPLQ